MLEATKMWLSLIVLVLMRAPMTQSQKFETNWTSQKEDNIWKPWEDGKSLVECHYWHKIHEHNVS